MKVSRGSANKDSEETMEISFTDGLFDAVRIAQSIGAIPVRGRHLDLPGHPHRFAKIIVRSGKKLEEIGKEGRICPVPHLAVTYDAIMHCGQALQVGANFSDISEIVIDLSKNAMKGPKFTLKTLKRIISQSYCLGLLGNEIAMSAAEGRRILAPMSVLFESFGPNHILNDDFDDGEEEEPIG